MIVAWCRVCWEDTSWYGRTCRGCEARRKRHARRPAVVLERWPRYEDVIGERP